MVELGESLIIMAQFLFRGQSAQQSLQLGLGIGVLAGSEVEHRQDLVEATEEIAVRELLLLLLMSLSILSIHSYIMVLIP